MARDLIRLAGQDPLDVQIVFTGLRPSEKLAEKLYSRRGNSRGRRGAEDPPGTGPTTASGRSERRQVLVSMAGRDREADLREALFAAVTARTSTDGDARSLDAAPRRPG